jgi:general secretion pathway protein D
MKQANKCAGNRVGLSLVLALGLFSDVGAVRTRADDAAPNGANGGEPALDIPMIGDTGPAASRKLNPRESEIVLMKDSEELRRLAFERHARESIAAGDRAFDARNYPLAEQRYKEALLSFREAGLRPENEVDRLLAQSGVRESIYQQALYLLSIEEYEDAMKMARQAQMERHPLAVDLKAQIERAKIPVDPPPPPPPPQRWKDQGFLDREKETVEMLTQAREYMLTGELDQAQSRLEIVMKRDPYNTEAIRMMEKVARRRDDVASMELEYTRRTMIADVRDTWNRRDYAVESAEFGVNVLPPPPPPPPPETDLIAKMKKIEIRNVDYRQANINDVIRDLMAASVEADPAEDPQDRRGVNMVLLLQDGTGGAAPAAPADDFGFGAAPGGAPAAGGGAPGQSPVNFTANYISLYDALKTVTQMTGLKFRVEDNVVKIVRLNAPDGPIIHRSYDVHTTFLDVMNRAAAEIDAGRSTGAGGDTWGGTRALAPMPGPAGVGGSLDPKEVFRKMGVGWPDRSSITYIPTIGKLVVANTLNNLTLFESKLAELNVVPNQIEIETRFVEIQQTDMSALGFEWGLSDDWEIAYQSDAASSGMIGRPYVRMMQNSQEGGFTRGLRYARDGIGGAGGVASELFSVGSVLTNPELSMTLHALQQNGNADLLSAPKITTLAGQDATIRVVTEMIYPTSFRVTPFSGTDSTGATTIRGGVVEPDGFQMREVGVILNVVAEPTAEGNLINLQMTPQVVSDPTWKDYGSTYIDADGTENTMPMPQPFFHTRSLSTHIMIFNGSTVVMGGMITENRTETDDNIPFLGNLPLIGRLFRSKRSLSEKRNLLIFVTARLVDPAGRAVVRRQKALVDANGGDTDAPVASPLAP